MSEAIFKERLQAIIDWADLAMKNREQFDSHGVRNLDGPVFDAAREALAANPSPKTCVAPAPTEAPPVESQAAEIDTGCVVVPTEPTEAMLERGASSTCSLTRHGARAVYRSMLEEAPKPANLDVDKMAKAIVLAACELDDTPDPDDDDTILITVQDLEAVAHRHITVALVRAALAAEGSAE